MMGAHRKLKSVDNCISLTRSSSRLQSSCRQPYFQGLVHRLSEDGGGRLLLLLAVSSAMNVAIGC